MKKVMIINIIIYTETPQSVRSSSLSCVAAIQSIPTHCYTSTMKRVLRNLQSPKGILSMRNTALFSFVISKSLSKPGFTPRDVVLEDAFYAEHFLKGWNAFSFISLSIIQLYL